MTEDRKYKKGKLYEGLGKYIGIINVYPYGEDYYSKNHQFAEETKDSRSTAKITEILIEKVKK